MQVHPECAVAWSWRKKFLISLEAPWIIVGLLTAAIFVKLLHYAMACCLGMCPRFETLLWSGLPGCMSKLGQQLLS